MVVLFQSPALEVGRKGSRWIWSSPLNFRLRRLVLTGSYPHIYRLLLLKSNPSYLFDNLCYTGFSYLALSLRNSTLYTTHILEMGSSARTTDHFFKPELGDVYVILDLGMTGIGMWTTGP